MKNILLVIAFLVRSILSAQEHPASDKSSAAKPASVETPAGRGAAPVTPHSALRTPQSTRAVVVGISDYQSSAIQDLQFADRDAEAFVAYLRSPAGGNVPEENIQLLTDRNATQGKMVAAFEWLTAETKPNDLAIIYFSGHGDVEIKSAAQLGFLLCADAPPASYRAGGAYPLIFLQSDVETISANGGKVLLVLDACHAGKLAGSAIQGTQATALALQQQYANEVKIMSCQPSELSLEGRQWGDGRGVFSFNLVEGLVGLADHNGDGVVQLREIDRYLGDVVPTETEPLAQNPMAVGEKLTVLARVDAPALEVLKKEKASRQPTLAKLDIKGMNITALAPGDSLAQQLYRRFEAALDSGRLIQPEGLSAWDYYRQLEPTPEIKPLSDLMRRNLAAALQDEVQQALNALLEADPEEVHQWRNNPAKYAQYPIYLERAISLLGEKHYMYKPLTAKKLYFEAYNLNRGIDRVEDLHFRDSVKQLAKDRLLQALDYEPDAAYIYHAIGYLDFVHNPYRSDSVMWYCNKAAEFAPNWALPYADMSGEWMWAVGNFQESEKCLRKLLAIKPDSYVALERYAVTCLWLNRVDEAKATCQRLIDMRPDIGAGYQIMTWASLQKQEYEAAAHFAQKQHEASGQAWSDGYLDYCRVLDRTGRYREGMVRIDSVLAARVRNTSNEISYNPANSLNTFGILDEKANACFDHGQYSRAREAADSIVHLLLAPGLAATGYCYLGKVAFRMGELAAAEKYLFAGIEDDPTPNSYDCWLFAYLGLIREKQGKLEEARQWFEKAETYAYWYSVVPIKIDSKLLYGEFLLRQGQPAEALEKFNFILENCPNDYRGWYGLALYHAGRNEHTLALDQLEKALQRFYPIPGPILEEPLFKKIRKTKRFKELLAKYFPETAKR